MADQAWETLPALLLEESKGFYDWTVKKHRNTFGLSEKTFIVCNAIKTGWRQAHPNTVALWKALDDMFRRAIQNPGETFRWGRIACRRDGNWVRIILPSGRSLCYPSPRIDDRNVSYMGINQYTRKWERIKTHGGKLAENVTQAASRDVFKHGELAAEQAGYAVVLPVHDELVTYAPNSPVYNPERLGALMATNPDWADGLLLAAAGFEASRYMKG